MELSYFIKLLRKKWLLIAIVSVLAAAATFVLLSTKQRQYYSRAQISAGITDNKQVSFEKAGDLGWSEIENRFTNFLEFLKSREVLSMVSYKMFITEVDSKGAYKPKDFAVLKQEYAYSDILKARNILQKKYDSLQILDLNNPEEYKVFEMLKDMYFDYKILTKTLNIDRIAGSDYIKIEVKTHHPVLSSNLINTYCNEAIRIHNSYEMKRAEKSVAFFKELRDKKKIDFERKLDSLSRMKSGSQMVDIAAQSEAHLNRMSTLEEGKNEESKKVHGLRKAIASVDAQLEQLGAESSSSHSYTNTAILHIKSEIERLNDRYINSGFRDKAAADSITILQAKLEKQLMSMTHKAKKKDGEKDIVTELKAKKMDYEIELSMAEAGLSSIERSIDADRGNLSRFVTEEANMTPLQMATNVAKEEYMHTVDRYNEVRNEALKNGTLVRQIEVAQPADEPEPAKRVLFSALAAFSTIILSLSVLFMIAYFDNTIKNPENFEANTGLPLLGFVYDLPKNTSNLEQIFFNNKTDNGARDKFKEQFRNIRFELEKSNNQILLVSSLEKQEGKSFFIMSLAYSLILNYKRILIIDTNFKHNTLSELYKGKNNFEEYLHNHEQKLLTDGTETFTVEGPVRPTEPYEEDIIQKTGIEGLDIISCRGNSLSPSEIFHGKHFEELLENLRFRYHYIIMEGPSLNLYSDTKELSLYCDKIIGVFAANRTLKRIDRESIKYLKANKEKYMGSVLNMVDAEDLLV